MRRSALLPLGLTLLSLLIRTVPGLAAELPRGTLIENLTCSGHPDQAYALYLPSSYRPDRTWPILYAFDARGQALIPAKAFQEAAETAPKGCALKVEEIAAGEAFKKQAKERQERIARDTKQTTYYLPQMLIEKKDYDRSSCCRSAPRSGRTIPAFGWRSPPGVGGRWERGRG